MSTFQKEESVNPKNIQAELARSLAYKDVTRGNIIGVIPRRELDGSLHYFAEIHMGGGYKVVIPEEDFDERLVGADRPYVQAFLRNRIGSAAYFVVTTFDMEGKLAMGDRIGAETLRRKYWTKEDTKLKEGEVVTGEIVTFTQKGVIVNLSGAESMIPLRELAHQFLKHPSQMFKVGQAIRMKLLSVTIKEDGGILFRASHKETVVNTAFAIYEEYIVDGEYKGEVTDIRVNERTTKPSLFVNITPEITVLCPSPYGRTPHIGSTVSVQITKKDKNEDRVFFWGKITYLF